MAFIDCIQSKVDARLVTRAKAKELQNKYDAAVKRYEQSMGDAQAASQAASDLVGVEAQRLADKKRNQMNAILMQEKIMDDLRAKERAGEKFQTGVIELLELANSRKSSINRFCRTIQK